MTSSADHPGGGHGPSRAASTGLVPLDELARGKNVRPIESAHDLAHGGIFDTDEELDAFLAHVATTRQTDSA
jgi:hypothetical protein